MKTDHAQVSSFPLMYVLPYALGLSRSLNKLHYYFATFSKVALAKFRLFCAVWPLETREMPCPFSDQLWMLVTLA